MIILAIGILLLYFYMSNRTDSPKETTVKELSEIGLLLGKDIELNYPDSPREVIKLYSRMTKCLYSDIEEADAEALAIKMKDLYDEEFFANYPEPQYLEDVRTDIDEYAYAERRISSYLIEKSSLTVYNEIEGRECATLNASFTTREKSGLNKTTEKFLLRKSNDGKWKILGWKIIENIDIQVD